MSRMLRTPVEIFGALVKNNAILDECFQHSLRLAKAKATVNRFAGREIFGTRVTIRTELPTVSWRRIGDA